MKNSSWILPFGMLLLLSLIWGSSFILMKLGLKAFDPVMLAALRLGISALVLSPLLLKLFRDVEKRDWPVLFVVGLFGNGIPAFLFAKAETVIDSAVAGILNVLSPLSILLIGALFFGARFAQSKIIGVLLGILGAVILILAGNDAVNFQENLSYSLLVVLATLCYSISANLMAYKLKGKSPLLITAYSISMIGWPAAVYLFAATDFTSVVSTHPDGLAALGYIAILGAVGTAFAVFIFTRLLQLTDAVFASSVTYLIPVVALVWGLIYGEKILPLQYVGMAIILGGVYLVNRRKKSKQVPSAEPQDAG